MVIYKCSKGSGSKRFNLKALFQGGTDSADGRKAYNRSKASLYFWYQRACDLQKRNFKKFEKALDKSPALWYNKDVPEREPNKNLVPTT